jgi:hypothetical protein
MTRNTHRTRARARAATMTPGTAVPAMVTLALLVSFALTFLRFG